MPTAATRERQRPDRQLAVAAERLTLTAGHLRPLGRTRQIRAARASTAAATAPGSLIIVRCRAPGISVGAGAPMARAVSIGLAALNTVSWAPKTTALGSGNRPIWARRPGGRPGTPWLSSAQTAASAPATWNGR